MVAGDIAGAGHWLELQYNSTLDKWVLKNPAIVAASTTQAGIVQLIDNLTTGGADKALTAEQGKALFAMFANSLLPSGYQKIPNPISPEKPLIIQWGSSSVDKGSLLDITLPIAYPNSHLRAFGILESDGLVSNGSFSICAAPQSNTTIRLSNSSVSTSSALVPRLS